MWYAEATGQFGVFQPSFTLSVAYATEAQGATYPGRCTYRRSGPPRMNPGARHTARRAPRLNSNMTRSCRTFPGTAGG